MVENAKERLQIATKHFVEENQKYWGDAAGPKNRGAWIYILHTLPNDIISTVHENIVAKGLQKNVGLPIVSVISGKPNEIASAIDASFGIEYSFNSSYHDYDNTEIQILAKKMCLETYGDVGRLLQLTYKNIKIGDAIYDDILRRGETGRCGEVFECFEISFERYYSFIRNALAVVDAAYEMFQKRKPSYIIVTDYTYTKALHVSVAKEVGAKIIITPVETPGMPMVISPMCHQGDFKCSWIRKAQMENCVRVCSCADIAYEDLFVIHSDDSERIVALDMLGLPHGRKNVLILPHALCDAPREGSSQGVYQDYCQWLLDTVRIVRNISGVNWIFKDHPYAAYYGQDVFCKEIFEKSKTENMYWMDKSISGMQIKNIADCVLTCVGDAGIEYWAYGIPTVTVGQAYYCDWGISYRAHSRNEYMAILNNVDKLDKPSTHSAKLAGKYLASFKRYCADGDFWTKLISKTNKRIWTIRRENCFDHGTSGLVDEQLYDLYSDFLSTCTIGLKENSLKESTVYQLKYLCEIGNSDKTIWEENLERKEKNAKDINGSL